MNAKLNRQILSRCDDATEHIPNHQKLGGIVANVNLPPRQARRRIDGRNASVQRAIALLAVLAGMSGLPAAQAQENETSQLKETVQQLVEQVQTLQARVKALEAAQGVRPDAAPVEHASEVSPVAAPVPLQSTPS